MGRLFQKNPRAHKNKIGTSPPPQNEEFYGHGFFLQKERIFPGAHKIGAAISGPRIAGRKFYGHVLIFLLIVRWNLCPVICRVKQPCRVKDIASGLKRDASKCLRTELSVRKEKGT